MRSPGNTTTENRRWAVLIAANYNFHCSAVSTMASLDNIIGLPVRLTTILDNDITGKLYAYCPTTDTVTLIEDKRSNESESASNSTSNGQNFRIVKIAFLKGITVLDKKAAAKQIRESHARQGSSLATPNPFETSSPAISPVSVSSITKTKANALKSLTLANMTKGKDVSLEAQDIFDAIFKTIQHTRWADKSIIVLDEVRIDPPYTVESCKAKDSNSQALDLVKKIVDGARKKIDQERKGG